jgi:phosphoglycolate phosphatase|tara:strand:+ start:791 stop:1474 length:684 start_codon:yes stop_codon:yes gene_type:complete
MSQKLTILFDLDGTLVDTAPDLVIAHNHVMKKFGFATKEANEIKALVGMGAKTMMSKTLWNAAKEEIKKVTEKDIKDKMVKEFIKFYGENILVESKLIKGAKDFLKWCSKNEISMGVCTNKQEHLAIDLLKKIGINDFFNYVAGSNTFDYCKPDPRHLTSVIEIIGGDIKKTIMIGDSEVDEKSAHNASLPFILLEGGYTNVDTSQMKFDHLIKDFTGLNEIIKNYL